MIDNELTTKELNEHIIYANSILTIAKKLDRAKVPYTLHKCWEGYQIRFPWSEGDIVAHAGSYGSRSGKVESMGFSWDADDVSTWDPDIMAVMVIAEYIIYRAESFHPCK